MVDGHQYRKIPAEWAGVPKEKRKANRLRLPVVRPPKRNEPLPDLTDEVIYGHYEQVALALQGRNGKIVDWETYFNRITICKECNGGWRCPHYCCGIQAKLAMADWHCKENKW